MDRDVAAEAKQRMELSLQHLGEEFKTLRTGRANQAMLDGVVVEYYGVPTPLKSLATINVPEAMQLVVQPFDKGAIKAIYEAIVKAELGFNPVDDGISLRIMVPALTAERRQDLVKKAKKMSEETNVALRQIRQDLNQNLEKMKKAGELSEDALAAKKKQIDDKTKEYGTKIDALLKEKEQEIMSV
jgi:ribosome recycling factor